MEKIPFKKFLEDAFSGGDYATDDVIAFVLPLFKEVLALHEDGLVAPFDREEALFVQHGVLDMDETLAHPPRNASAKLAALAEKGRSKNFDIVDRLKLDTDVGEGTQTVASGQLHVDLNTPFDAPVYLPGYRCFEIVAGHHDDSADIFCLGLILGSVALGVDLYDEEELKLFVQYRGNPSWYHHRLHPVIGTLITEMTQLDRAKRSGDLYDVIRRLEHYRDYDPEQGIDLAAIAGWKTKEISSKGGFILGKLRNRLFDTSRRNRLLYYKPNMRFVNLTVSSVPMVLHYQSIRPELLFTWNDEISAKVRDMKELVLNKYLRFEDHTYLKTSLDKIRSEAQHDIQEYGFSQLKLVIAFLNWHNLKEELDERIQSPLLLVPVELKKVKKLKEDHYIMKPLANEAEVNPIVANQLRELYGIRLPDFINLDDTTLVQFYEQLKAQIDGANQGITLHYVGKPRIKLVHSVARQTVTNYKKRLRKGSRMDSYKNMEYSYAPEHYKPLGLQIFRDRIAYRATELEFLLNEDIKATVQHLTGSKERDLYELADSENNPYSWDFDVCNAVLGNFNYKKMSLVRDYNSVIDGNLHHPVFEHLFSDQPRKISEQHYDLSDPQSWHHVIAADPTQTKAILQARTGESYIIQGPPGTGKSQTITNLIADFVAQGKNILFVCEKRAALDVVFFRLKQQGLDELCCYIHDSQGDKRAFIKNLKETYEDFIKNRPDLQKIEDDRATLLQSIGQQLSLLANYHDTAIGFNEHAGTALRHLIGRLIELKPLLTQVSPVDAELLPHYKEWKEFGDTVHQLSVVLEESGADPWFAGHPFSALQEDIFLSETPSGLLRQLLKDAQQGLETIVSVYEAHGIPDGAWQRFDGVKALIEDAVLLHPLAESGNLLLVDLQNKEAKAFERSWKGLKDLQKELKLARGNNNHWRRKYPAGEVHSALALASAQEGSFFSFFNGAWRTLKKDLNEAYDFSAHLVKPKYSEVLRNLEAEYTLEKSVQDLQASLADQYGLQDMETAYTGMERIRAKKGDHEVDFLLQHPYAAKLVKALHGLNSTLWSLEATLRQLLHDHNSMTISALRDTLDNIDANSDVLPELLPALRRYATASAPMKKLLRTLSLQPKGMEAALANKSLHHIYQYNKSFASCDGSTIENAVAAIRKSFRQLLHLNATFIRAKVRTKFLHNLELSNRAVSQLTAEQKAFKKMYTEGRKVLENEFGKSMRYKSIRELAGRESGAVLKDLKPVWLMSPLSVSDSLPVDAATFDVVIFDEASQITLEEGIPSLYRAPQTIIVGDDKQMPPTNFFSARAEDPDDLEAMGIDSDDELLSNDADSLLVQGSRKLDSVMLGWHYRSRYETLISYSNHAFYEANLLTIPDRTIHHAAKAPIEVKVAEDAVQFADALFDRSISFHFHPSSLYEKRANIDEANYIAHLVHELLRRKVPESIGIVAFSQEQQRTIEDALTLLATEDKDFALLLNEAYDRHEDDQYVGLIVKNLENIQGDERDIIIMSVCYGPDARRKVLMNFGPINKKGGEKRLNVLFSRAKKHMAVVSSMQHHQITNEYNEGANYFKRFLHYAEGVSTGNMAMARSILDSLVERKENRLQGGRSMVLNAVKTALQQEGYEVAENVGQSGFKCSLGVKKHKEDDAYTLGILLDDDTHYANENLLEQYWQRPAILEDFGWRTISIFSKDWLHAPGNVLAAIKKRLLEEPKREEEDVAFDMPLEPRYFDAAAPIANPVDSSAMTPGMYDHLSYQRLHFSEGSSNKFWEVATDGNRMVVRFGRIGTRGQTSVKTYASPEKAVEEAAKMRDEKMGKGYKEA